MQHTDADIRMIMNGIKKMMEQTMRNRQFSQDEKESFVGDICANFLINCAIGVGVENGDSISIALHFKDFVSHGCGKLITEYFKKTTGGAIT